MNADNQPTAVQPTEVPTNARWYIFALICFTSFLTYVHRYSWSVIRPYLQEDYGMSDLDMGWLDSAFNLTYALCQFPGGLAGDLFGPRMVIPLAAMLWSLIVAGPAMVVGFTKLAAVRLVFGVTQAASYPNLGKITKSWFPVSVRTSVQGTVASLSGRAGGACAPLIVATLLMGLLNLKWQTSLWVIAIAGFLFAAVFWQFFRNTPGEHPWVNDAERELIEFGEVAASPNSKPRFDWTAANCRNFAFFLAASFSSTFADNLFVFWMPTFLKEAKGFNPIEMGVYASLPLWGGALGGWFGGFLNDILIRVLGNRRMARSIVASTGKIVAAVLIVVSMLPEDGRAVMLILGACKFFSDWSQPTWWGTVTDIGGPSAGRVFGLANTVGSIGATVAGPVMGLVKQDFGWEALFYFVGAIYLVTATFWAFVNCTRKLVVQPDESDMASESADQNAESDG